MARTDLRSLSRLAAGPARSPRRSRGLAVRRVGGAPAIARRRRVPRWLAVVVGVAVGVLGYLAAIASGQSDADSVLAQIPAVSVARGSDAGTRLPVGARADRSGGRDAATAPVSGDRAFADVEGLALALPYPAPEAVAFHEASRPDALALTPLGRLVANDNPERYAPPADAGGPEYRVLSSRGRPRPATSAVDVAVPPGATAVAPVTGTVVEVREYVLYGRVRDWRVVVEPEERPDLYVVLIHLHRPSVRPGARVEAGRTPLAVVRRLPLPSHVEEVVDEPGPHVHLEVKPATADKPVDPNAPAMDARERLEEVTGHRPSGS